MNRENINWTFQKIFIILLLLNSCKKDDKTLSNKIRILFNSNLSYGSMTDQDGNTYKTVTIGTQTWMAENLRTTTYRSGESIPKIIDNDAWNNLITGAYCNNENTESVDTIAAFGRLYNWYALSDSRNIAPIGWHVPTDTDWTILITYLGGDSIAGGKLKEIGTVHWVSPNTGATNSSGFTALPCGFRYFSSWSTFGYNGCWWSSTDLPSAAKPAAYCQTIKFNYNNVDRGLGFKFMGASVRCLRDK